MVNRANVKRNSDDDQMPSQSGYSSSSSTSFISHAPSSATSYSSAANGANSLDDNNAQFDQTVSKSLQFDQTDPNSTTDASKSKRFPLGRFLLRGQVTKPLLQQLVTQLIPGVLLPLTVIGVISYALQLRQDAAQAERLLEQQTRAASEIIRQFLNEGLELSTIVATSPFVLAELRSATQFAQANGLLVGSPEQLEQQLGPRFDNTRQLRPNPALNNYLKGITDVSEIGDFLVTEKNGLAVGYAFLPGDFVQSDEEWWQKSKTLRQVYYQQSYDESLDVRGFEIIMPVIDPVNNEFLGVMEVVSPAEFFDRMAQILEAELVFDSIEIQVLGRNVEGALAPVTTLAQDGVTQAEEILGGEAILGRVQALKEIIQAENPEAAANQANIPITLIPGDGNERKLTSTWTYQGRNYIFASVPTTEDWFVVASVESTEIVARSRNQALLSVLLFLAVGAIATGIIVRVARQLSKPLTQLTATANEVASGNLNVQATLEGSTETQTLAGSFNNLVSRVKGLLQAQIAETERSQILRDVTLEITQVETAEAILTQFPVSRVRQVMKADRIIVYRFDENWEGAVITESVGSNYPRSLGAKIHDPCFEKGYADRYKRGRIQATPDIYTAELSECYLKQLEQFAIKASLIVPVKQGEQLVALLMAHQCSGPRNWGRLEVDFLAQIATQLGLALERRDLLTQTENSAEQARTLAEQQRQQKETLQRQLIELLSDVEGAASGDLTVRADVSAGEIGTVADFFNSIIESLRQIVTKVKQSAVQVNSSLGQNEEAIRVLADEALKQAEETIQTLDSVEEMTRSIQTVAESANQAAKVARAASETAESGGIAMDLTVQNILNLRETVGETAKKVKRLGESSQQISKVVSLINQIAMQTNLLAINAGIEAARAGEEGQGFAVVAEEVGELAARSTAATQEIERIVENIQRETSQVVEAIEQSTSQVVEGTRRVEEAKLSLNQILDVSRQIDGLVQSISEATVSQVQTSAAVSKLMKDVAQVSERTSDSSRRVSTALRETVEVAQELQASVGAFKVGA